MTNASPFALFRVSAEAELFILIVLAFIMVLAGAWQLVREVGLIRENLVDLKPIFLILLGLVVAVIAALIALGAL